VRNALYIITGFLMVAIAVAACKKDAIQQQPPTITSFTPTFDTTNGTVTITGTNFVNVTAVSFGGTVAASFKVLNATVIVAKVGAGSSGNVAVATAGGIATAAGFSYPYIYCGCSSSNDIEAANLIGHWPFDSGAIEDISRLSPMLTGGTITYVTGRIGKAIHLVNGWLTYPAAATYAGIANSILNSNDTLENGFTISLWMQLPPTIANGDTLLTNLFQLSGYPGTANWPLAGISAAKFPDSTLSLFGGVTNIDSLGIHNSYDSSFLNGRVLDTLGWAFIAMVYDTVGHQLQYYFNGAYLAASTLRTGDTVATVFPVSEVLLLPTPNYATIGAFESTIDFPSAPASDQLPYFMNPGLTGTLDDIRLFNKSLTAQDISDLYNLGTSGR
jgi:hypothetical protein